MKPLLQKPYKMALVSALALSLGACTSYPQDGRYDRSEINRAQYIERGVVESWREVDIQTETGVGTAVGVGTGAAAGAAIGGDGAGGVIGAILGGLIGGSVGNNIDRNAGRRQGFEYIVATPSGERIAIVEVANRPIPVGAPVIVQMGGGTDRIRIDQSRVEQ